MKKKTIIAIIAIFITLVLIACVITVFANRNRFPRKINSADRFEEVFGVAIDPEFVVEEYSRYTMDNDMNYPQTYLCFKLDMTHEELVTLLDEADEWYKTSQFNEFWGLISLNDLLPKEKKLDLENLDQYGHYFLTDRYEAVPGLFEYAIQQNVYWCSCVENEKEVTYVYTYKYRKYVPDMVD